LRLFVRVVAMRRVRRHSPLLMSHAKIAITRRVLVDKRIWRIDTPPPVAKTETATVPISSRGYIRGSGALPKVYNNNFYQCHSVVLLTISSVDLVRASNPFLPKGIKVSTASKLAKRK